jgi:cytochrome b561
VARRVRPGSSSTIWAGIAIIILITLRIAWRMADPPPPLVQAWDEQDKLREQQVQLDAQAIMAGMDQARIRAALLARMGR